MDIFGRVTCSYAVFSPVTAKLAANASEVIVYEHNENVLNVHVHFLIKGLKCSTDTLKNWIRRDTGRKFAATDWSFKTKYKPRKDAPEVPVSDSCITYMSKGKLTPNFSHGFKAEHVEDLLLKWLDYKKEAKQQSLKSYILKESQQASKLRQDQMIAEICKRVDESHDQTPEFILQTIRQVVIVENKTILGRYKCRDYYDTVRSRTNPDQWIVSMRNLVQDKIIS